MSNPYPRAELTKEEMQQIQKVAHMFFSQPHNKQRATVALLLAENASLTREINEHRIARGFDPIPTVPVSK